MATVRTIAGSCDLDEGLRTVRRSPRCRALPKRQVAGVCEQRIAQTQTRAQCRWPDTAIKVIQKGIEGKGKMAFVPVIERGRKPEADPARCRGPREPSDGARASGGTPSPYPGGAGPRSGCRAASAGGDRRCLPVPAVATRPV